jgi:purine-binding chemotaxis protein CheW
MSTAQTASPTTAPDGGNPASWGGGAETAAGKTGAAQFVTFTIGDDQYGVDIMAVREIKGWSEITHLPKQPEYVRGVLNLRGVMVPIIDLRCRFGQGLTEATPVHVVIIVQIEQRLVGLLGDSVSDIVTVDSAQIQAVPRVAQSTRIDFLAGLVTIEGAMIALIDLPNLLAVQAEESASLSVIETKPAAAAKSN